MMIKKSTVEIERPPIGCGYQTFVDIITLIFCQVGIEFAKGVFIRAREWYYKVVKSLKRGILTVVTGYVIFRIVSRIRVTYLLFVSIITKFDFCNK